jgi:beta-phosphoglucomutase
MGIKAVVFDMDGVLIDAAEWHYLALNRALGLFGYNISRHDHLTTFNGLPTHKKLEILTMDRGLTKGLHAFIHEMKQRYTNELIYARCKPTFQHELALSRLKAEGYKLAVASNAIRKTVELMMNLSRLSPLLDLMLSCEDVATPKPSPAIYLEVQRRLGVQAEECLIVEDAAHGVRAARDSGAYCMVVEGVHDVSLDNIRAHIMRIEQERAKAC